MDADPENILLDENKILVAKLISANVKVNILTMEVSHLNGTLEITSDTLRRYKDQAREEEMES